MKCFFTNMNKVLAYFMVRQQDLFCIECRIAAKKENIGYWGVYKYKWNLYIGKYSVYDWWMNKWQ